MHRVVASYDARTIDSSNPVVRFAHRSRLRFSMESADSLLPKGGTLVDFGAGTGAFLSRFIGTRPDADACAIEPYETILDPQIRQVRDLREVASDSVDLVTCMEVCEHLSDDELDSFLRETRRVLKPDGKALITVPIMYGLALPVKEYSRVFLYRNGSEYRRGEMLRAVLGRPVERTATRLKSHKGFDFRWLEDETSRHLSIAERRYSPFAKLPWWLNSQLMLVAKPR